MFNKQKNKKMNTPPQLTKNVVVPAQTIQELTAQINQMSLQLAQLQSKENERFITIKEVSRLTGLCRNTILKYTEMGIFKAEIMQLTSYKKYLYNRAEILNYNQRRSKIKPLY